MVTNVIHGYFKWFCTAITIGINRHCLLINYKLGDHIWCPDFFQVGLSSLEMSILASLCLIWGIQLYTAKTLVERSSVDINCHYLTEDSWRKLRISSFWLYIAFNWSEVRENKFIAYVAMSAYLFSYRKLHFFISKGKTLRKRIPWGVVLNLANGLASLKKLNMPYIYKKRQWIIL